MGTINKLFVSLVLLSASLEAMEWVSYNQALKIQKQTHQPIMLDVMRTDCHYCIDMEKKVFQDDAMAKWLTQRFIPVKINLDTDTMPIDQEVTFTPTFFFLDGQGKIIKKIPGSWNIQDFKDLTKGIK
ncbi:thioredoxin family protein [Sulfurimonas marina]|uniref:thioredoxin family protein n=1 Tax=Sulfurimonas marina TaxID=2590551 RepID=UPI001D0360A8|nr:thioredoxin family protein [Sulfurimonas marina]